MPAVWFSRISLLLLATASLAQGQEPRLCEFVDTDSRFELVVPASRAEWEVRADALRRRVRWAAGLLPELPRPSIVAEVIPRWSDEHCRVECVRFESAPGLFVYGNLYRPIRNEGRFPLVLSPHGHWGSGRFQHSEECSVPARCVALARAGAIVFAYDMLGFGDAKRHFGHREARFESELATYYGLHSFALQTWNSMRALDFLMDLPNADREKVAITGASGGGTQSFVLACVDSRVRVCMPVNMVSAIMQGGCPCENADGLRWGVSNPELAAVFAPRPLLLISASGDWTRETPRNEFPYLRGVYDLFGATDQVANAHFDAGHNYGRASRQAMYAFVQQHLLSQAEIGDFMEAPLPPAESLPYFASSNQDHAWPGAEDTWERLLSAVRSRTEEFAPRTIEQLEQLRLIVHEALDHAAGSPFPPRAKVAYIERSESTSTGLVRDQRHIAIERMNDSEHSSNSGRIVLFAHPDGIAAGSKCLKRIQEWQRQGFEVVLLEPFGAGVGAAAIRNSQRGKTRYFTTFQRSNQSEALEDLTTAMSWFVGDPACKELCAVGDGWCGALMLAASARIDAATAKRLRLRVDVELEGECYGLPVLGRVGGIKALLAAQAAVETTSRLHCDLDVEHWARSAAALERRSLRILRKE